MPINTPQGQPSDSPVAPFQGASFPNIIGYKFKDLDPGANVYVQRDDKLVIQFTSQTSAEVFNVNVRLLQPGRLAGRTQPDVGTTDNQAADSPYGVIVPINIQVPATTTNTIFTKTIDLSEGYLMSVGINATISTQRGLAFARVYLIRGTANVNNFSYLLCSGYVTTQTAAGWPFGSVVSPLDGAGFPMNYNPANPGAGAEFGFAVINPLRYQIRYVQATLTTSATVANRLPCGAFFITSGAVPCGLFPGSQVVPASTVAKVTFAPGVAGNSALATVVNVSLPQPSVLSGVTGNAVSFQSLTQNIQAGDQWSNIGAVIEQWYDL